MSRKSMIAVLAAVLCVPALSCLSAEPDVVVAQVGGEPVFARDVARLLKAATHGKAIDPEVVPALRAQVLEEIVNRRLVLAYARDRGESPGEKEIAAGAARFESGLSAKGESLAGYLKAQGLSESDLQRQIAWQLVWEKYLARYLTDARVAAFWKDRHREFDGTELEVSHILLRGGSAGGPREADDRMRRAEQLRGEIASGKIAFAEAARKHSEGPSATDGGRLGFIGRRGPMDDAFSRAAFALAPGQVSPPVRTRFGVHLIRCDAVKPGDRGLAEVRKEVEEALARELLEKLAAVQRRSTRVEYADRPPGG